ncbi:MAG: dihydrolipoamide acetyltransferase component of pyruvate dehydrogenase complex [Armatimonadota bacterium]|nr:MAG: dihydrolipoamide acetyltransferase component of pyruvate dehydrogenase complex [Armatimonadota bacterium]
MAEYFNLPMLGQTMEEGTITRWLKAEGDYIRRGDIIAEVMTDKANLEVDATFEGYLRKILVAEGETIPVNAPIAIISKTPDEDISALLTPGAKPEPQPAAAQVAARESAQTAPVAQTSATTTTEQRLFISPRARRLAQEKGVPLQALAGRGTGPQGRILERDVESVWQELMSTRPRVTPLAEKVAAEAGVDVAAVAGTGVGGRVTKEDVLRATTPSVAPAPPPPVTPTAPPAGAQVIKLAGLRKLVAENVVKGFFSAPPVTLVAEVDMTDCVRLREQLMPEVEKAYGTRLTYTDLIVKAVARALREFPLMNATLQDDQITIHADINVGVAVAVEEGLLVPVVKGADCKTLGEISRELKEMAERARAGKSTPDDLSGGTFTITNLGAYDVEMFNPVLVPGQTGILGVGRIAEKPAIREGQMVARHLMNLCLTFDHRVLDGAPAARFLQRVKALLESPMLLLI